MLPRFMEKRPIPVVYVASSIYFTLNCVFYSVCKAWNEIVTEIKRKRSRLHWFCLQGDWRKEDPVQNIYDQLMQAFQVRKSKFFLSLAV